MQILLTQRHRLIRDSMRPLLGRIAPNCGLTEAADLADAARRVDDPSTIDLVLLGEEGGAEDGVSLIRAMKASFCRAKLVLLMLEPTEPRVVLQAIDAGADGVMFNSISAQEMLTALRSVMAGSTYLPTEIVRALAEKASHPGKASHLPHFSPCELAVVPLLKTGLANKLIAQQLGIEEPAVKARLRSIYKKIGAGNRAQAVMALFARDEQDWDNDLRIATPSF